MGESLSQLKLFYNVRKERIPVRGLKLVAIAVIHSDLIRVRKERISVRGLKLIFRVVVVATFNGSEKNESP